MLVAMVGRFEPHQHGTDNKQAPVPREDNQK